MTLLPNQLVNIVRMLLGTTNVKLLITTGITNYLKQLMQPAEGLVETLVMEVMEGSPVYYQFLENRV